MRASIHVDTLMVLDGEGEEIVHLLDTPMLYENLHNLQVPEEIKEEVGTELDSVAVAYYGIEEGRVSYIIPALPYWIVTICRERGMLWGELKTPLVH